MKNPLVAQNSNPCRNSMMNLSPAKKNYRKSGFKKHCLKLYNTASTEPQSAPIHRGRNSCKPINEDIFNKLDTPKINSPFETTREDACELKEFIELEDFCRRTTVAGTGEHSTTEKRSTQTRHTSKNSTLSTKGKVAKVPKPTKKYSKAKCQGKGDNKDGSHLVKTFAITISKDNKIIY